MGEEQTWASAWNCQLTDYAQIQLKTSKFIQKIRIKNNLLGNAVRICFSNVFSTEEFIFQVIRIHINDREPYVMTKNQRTEILLPAGSLSESDELKAEIYPGDYITIEAETIENTRLSDGALIPDTEMLKVENIGKLICTQEDDYQNEISKIPDKFQWIFGICGIEIKTDGVVKSIACFGDSLTQIPYWISPVAMKLYETYPEKVTLSNYGISGNRLLYETMDLGKNLGNLNGSAGVERFERDVFSKTIPDCVFLLEGINDIIFPFEYRKMDEMVKSDAIIKGLESCISICSKYSSKPILATLLPFKGYFCWNGRSERIRQEVNEWIRKQQNCLYIDFDHYAADSRDPRCLKKEWRNDDDLLHLNALGGKELAQAILDSDKFKSVLVQLFE